MPNYFYIDANGQKHGLVNDQQLQTLAAQGVITPNTPLETEGGHKGVAGQIPGLRFNTAASTPFAQMPQAAPHTLAAQAGILARKAGVGGILVWLLDFAFRDLRLPVINLWACRIIYVICCIAAILWGIAMTFMLLALAADSSGHADTGPVMLFVIPLAWLGVILSIFAARLFCEWYIIIFDWIIETTKAARIYSENNKKK